MAGSLFSLLILMFCCQSTHAEYSRKIIQAVDFKLPSLATHMLEPRALYPCPLPLCVQHCLPRPLPYLSSTLLPATSLPTPYRQYFAVILLKHKFTHLNYSDFLFGWIPEQSRPHWLVFVVTYAEIRTHFRKETV